MKKHLILFYLFDWFSIKTDQTVEEGYNIKKDGDLIPIRLQMY